MAKKPFVIVEDPTMRAIADEITDLIERCDELAAKPSEPEATAAFIADIRSMMRDLDAELLARNPPPEWSVLDEKLKGIVQ